MNPIIQHQILPMRTAQLQFELAGCESSLTTINPQSKLAYVDGKAGPACMELAEWERYKVLCATWQASPIDLEGAPVVSMLAVGNEEAAREIDQTEAVRAPAYELPLKTYAVGEVQEDKHCDGVAVAYCLPPEWEVLALDSKQAMERASHAAYMQSRGRVRNVWVRLKPPSQAIQPEDLRRIYRSLRICLHEVRTCVTSAQHTLSVEDYGEALQAANEKLSLSIGCVEGLESGLNIINHEGGPEAA